MASSQQQQNLTGKVAIVTGSGRGIGAAIALKLASHGANVVINYHSSAEKAEAVASKARTFGVQALCIKADVSQRSDVASLFQQTKQQLGRIDIVMSNSGIEHFGDLSTVTEEQLDRVFNVNIKGQFFVAQEAYTHMENNGRLVLISSLSAVKGFARHAVYGASKAAIQGMVRSLAYDFGPRGITVNCIAPGGIKTDMWTEVAGEYLPGGENMSAQAIEDMVSEWSPMKRAGEVEDIANVVAVIASPEAQWITGQTVHANGGAYMI